MDADYHRLTLGELAAQAGVRPVSTGSSAPSRKSTPRRRILPKPPAHSHFALWVGNVPFDADHEELELFFNSQPPPPGTTSPGVDSVHLITRSHCAFVNYVSQVHLDFAAATCHNAKLRPHLPASPELVCRVRRVHDDVSSGVGIQRGTRMHRHWVARVGPSSPSHPSGSTSLQAQTPDVSSSLELLQPVPHLPSKIPTDPASSTPHTPPALSPFASAPDPRPLSHASPDTSGSTASTTSSLLTYHFPRRYFVLKSHSEPFLRASVDSGLWSTQPHNEPILDQAFRTASDGVYIIFGANRTGQFFGYARMIGPVPGASRSSTGRTGTSSSRGKASFASGTRDSGFRSQASTSSSRQLPFDSSSKGSSSVQSKHTSEPLQIPHSGAISSQAESTDSPVVNVQKPTTYQDDDKIPPRKDTAASALEIPRTNTPPDSGNDPPLSSDRAGDVYSFTHPPYPDKSSQLEEDRPILETTSISHPAVISNPSLKQSSQQSSSSEKNPGVDRSSNDSGASAISDVNALPPTSRPSPLPLGLQQHSDTLLYNSKPRDEENPTVFSTAVNSKPSYRRIRSSGDVKPSSAWGKQDKKLSKEEDYPAIISSSDGERRSSERARVPSTGNPFKIEWIYSGGLPFYKIRNLRNPFNRNREVKISRDGTEIEPSVGEALLSAFKDHEQELSERGEDSKNSYNQSSPKDSFGIAVSSQQNSAHVGTNERSGNSMRKFGRGRQQGYTRRNNPYDYGGGRGQQPHNSSHSLPMNPNYPSHTYAGSAQLHQTPRNQPVSTGATISPLNIHHPQGVYYSNPPLTSAIPVTPVTTMHQPSGNSAAERSHYSLPPQQSHLVRHPAQAGFYSHSSAAVHTMNNNHISDIPPQMVPGTGNAGMVPPLVITSQPTHTSVYSAYGLPHHPQFPPQHLPHPGSETMILSSGGDYQQPPHPYGYTPYPHHTPPHLLHAHAPSMHHAHHQARFHERVSEHPSGVTVAGSPRSTAGDMIGSGHHPIGLQVPNPYGYTYQNAPPLQGQQPMGLPRRSLHSSRMPAGDRSA